MGRNRQHSNRTFAFTMTQVGQNSLGTRSTLNVGGKDYAYYSLSKASEKIGDISRLPFSMKVLLENLLRFEDGGFTVGEEHIRALAGWQNNPVTGEETRVDFGTDRTPSWQRLAP